MAAFVFPAPAPTTLPVAGSAAVFPVGRVFCIGHSDRGGQDDQATPLEMPVGFMKPAFTGGVADIAKFFMTVGGDQAPVRHS